MSTLTKNVLVMLSLVLLTANTACSKSKSANRQPAPSTPSTAPTGSDPNQPGQDDGDEHTQHGTPPGAVDEEPGTQPPVDERYTVGDTTIRTETTDDEQGLQNGDGLDEVMSHPDVTNALGDGPARNKECGTAYRRNTQAWYPGLPYPPAQQRICTGGKVGEVKQEDLYKCEPGTGYIFTDSRQDSLMAVAVERFNKIPESAQIGSRELAENIRDFKVTSDPYQTGEVKVQFALLVGEEKYETFVLKGRMREWRGKNRTDVNLRKVTKAGLTFSGVLTCADLQIGCKNSLIRLHQHGRSGKIKRAAYIVHRWGDAHVTISDKDLNHFNQIESRNYRDFAQFLSNTANNACLSILGDVQTGKRQMPECAQRRLLAQCGRKQWQSPAAKVFDFRGWAVAYGRSGFEFNMIESGAYDFEKKDNVRLSIRGPLIASNQLPMWGRPLKVDGSHAEGISNVALVSNDGGGNLNLQVDFKGESKSFTRISLTTLIEDTLFNAEQMVQDASQMPALDGAQIELDDNGGVVEKPEQPLAPPVEPGVEQHSEGDLG
jgi:hypothetical protein